MVYDPIRDCEVPSPATTTTAPPSANAWGTRRTPGSEGPGGVGHHNHQQQQQYPPGYYAQPPAFGGGQRSPVPSRSMSGGAIRGLLNEEDGRRSSDPRSSVSSNAGQYDDQAAAAPRPSIHQLLNSTPAPAPALSQSNSASSITHSSSPSNASPGQRYMDPNTYLTPLPAGHRQSRSPHPLHENVSPGMIHNQLGPHEYHDLTPGYAAQSRRVSGGSVQRPMLPPQDIPQHYDHRLTPTASHLPLRSPSVSVSPRTYHASLGAGFSTSRPGSSSASQVYAMHAPSVSPSVLDRRLSEEFSRPTSADVHPGRRSAAVSRRNSFAPAFSPPRRTRSPSVDRRAPYNPHRISEPRSVLAPIRADELADLKALGLRNNPLRRRSRKPLPSWSGASSSKLPHEADTSYFPPQDDRSRQGSLLPSRRGSVSSAGRMSTTPAPGYDRASGTPVDHRAGQSSNGRRHVSTTSDGQGRKRLHEPEPDHGHDAVRRKVSDGAYVGNAGNVASHYNSRPEVGVAHREFSPIIGLKKFNNWIKSVLIGKFAYRQQGRPGAHVLDIGCGKGGDLNKWKQARIRLYVALDIASTSIEQAHDRYTKLRPQPFDGYFFAYDCFTNPIDRILPPQLAERNLYDNVTMQFCMHYAFETAAKARMMMENVSRYLRPGGVFIGTIPDSELLLTKLAAVPEDQDELRFGNSCYYVEFAERKHKGIYGHEYRFYLEDAVGDVPEYIVHWQNFESLASEYGLRVIYKKRFHEVLEEEQSSRDFGPLLKKMGVLNDSGESAMNEDQWEAANLYMAFAFEKVQ